MSESLQVTLRIDHLRNNTRCLVYRRIKLAQLDIKGGLVLILHIYWLTGVLTYAVPLVPWNNASEDSVSQTRNATSHQHNASQATDSFEIGTYKDNDSPYILKNSKYSSTREKPIRKYDKKVARVGKQSIPSLFFEKEKQFQNRHFNHPSKLSDNIKTNQIVLGYARPKQVGASLKTKISKFHHQTESLDSVPYESIKTVLNHPTYLSINNDDSGSTSVATDTGSDSAASGHQILSRRRRSSPHSTSKFTGLVVGATENKKLRSSVAKTLKDIEQAIWSLQSNVTRAFSDDKPASILGTFSSTMFTNFRGFPKESKLRNSDDYQISDVNAMTQLLVLNCITEAGIYGSAQNPDVAKVLNMLNALDVFHTQGRKGGSPLITMWPEQLSQETKIWTPYPENLLLTKVKDTSTMGQIRAISSSCETCKTTKQGLDAISKDQLCTKHFETSIREHVGNRASPPDVINSFLNLALGALFNAKIEHKDNGDEQVFATELKQWVNSNSRFDLLIDKLKEIVIIFPAAKLRDKPTTPSALPATITTTATPTTTTTTPPTTTTTPPTKTTTTTPTTSTTTTPITSITTTTTTTSTIPITMKTVNTSEAQATSAATSAQPSSPTQTTTTPSTTIITPTTTTEPTDSKRKETDAGTDEILLMDFDIKNDTNLSWLFEEGFNATDIYLESLIRTSRRRRRVDITVTEDEHTDLSDTSNDTYINTVDNNSTKDLKTVVPANKLEKNESLDIAQATDRSDKKASAGSELLATAPAAIDDTTRIVESEQISPPTPSTQSTTPYTEIDEVSRERINLSELEGNDTEIRNETINFVDSDSTGYEDTSSNRSMALEESMKSLDSEINTENEQNVTDQKETDFLTGLPPSASIDGTDVIKTPTAPTVSEGAVTSTETSGPKTTATPTTSATSTLPPSFPPPPASIEATTTQKPETTAASPPHVNQVLDSVSYFALRAYLDDVLPDCEDDILLIPSMIPDTPSDFLYKGENGDQPSRSAALYAKSLRNDGDIRHNGKVYHRFNSVDPVSSATALHALIVSSMAGLVDIKAEPELQKILRSTLHYLTWLMNHPEELLTSVALSRFPSRFQLYLVLSRATFQLTSLQSRDADLFGFGSVDVENFLAAVHNRMTLAILESIQDAGLGPDGKTRVYIDDFVGTSDFDKKGKAKVSGDDRIFSSAIAASALIFSWTTQEEKGSLRFDKDTPDAVRIAVNSLVNYIIGKVLNDGDDHVGPFYSDLIKNCQTIPTYFPSNTATKQNGEAIDLEQASANFRFGVKGYIQKSDYEARLVSAKFGRNTPSQIDARKLNDVTSFHRFWSSLAYTRAACLLAVSLAANVQVDDVD